MKREGKDPALVELVEYFESPGVAPNYEGNEGGWVRLNHPNNAREMAAIEAELRKCRQDFSYFSRNFLYIRTKEREKIPFRLNESQELILEKVYTLKAMGLPQRLIILKARQLGCSTLIEGLLTWRTVLFMNTIAVIVSSNPDHAAYLFRFLQFFYDNLPWWMRPMTLSRKIEEGLIFDNPNHKDRHLRGGLNSEISVQAANQGAGVGQGRTVQAAHASEIGDWTDEEGKSVIEGDLGHALAQNAETFAAIESTAKGTGNYFHRLWRRNVELGEMANWHPVFLPWFFEKNRRIIIPNKIWKPSFQELEMRDRLKNEWLRCTNKDCQQFLEKFERGLDQSGIKCHGCGIGDMVEYELDDQQLYWMQRERLNAEKDADSLKAMKAELCSTAEEAFQLSGVQVFPQECLDFVNRHLEEPKVMGYLDKAGVLHGVAAATGRCPQVECNVDHSYENLPLHVFRYPEKNANYVIGVDVSEGLGEDSDSSVIFVNKVGSMREPDEQVAVFRSNTISPVEFAHPVSMLGFWYNEALLAIEINKYDTTFSYVRQGYSYPNLYRWKYVDSTNVLSHKWGWETNMKSKPRLWQTGTYWLKNRSWIIHSKNFYQEMTTFQKESAEDRGAKAEKGFYDDEMMAGLISLYCSHDSDWDENLGMIPIRRNQSGDPAAFMWKIVCNKCGYERGVPSPEGAMYCLDCSSKFVRAEKNVTILGNTGLWEELESGSETPLGTLAEPEYELM